MRPCMPRVMNSSIGSGSRTEVVVPYAPRIAWSAPTPAPSYGVAVVAVGLDEAVRDAGRVGEVQALRAEELGLLVVDPGGGEAVGPEAERVAGDGQQLSALHWFVPRRPIHPAWR